MKFRLPDECSPNGTFGIDAQEFPVADGVVDLPDIIVTDYAEQIAAHGLTVVVPGEPVTARKRRGE